MEKVQAIALHKESGVQGKESGEITIFAEISMEAMSDNQHKVLLKAQQGELDVVPMYKALSSVAKHERDRLAFLQLASEEGHHAAKGYEHLILDFPEVCFGDAYP